MKEINYTIMHSFFHAFWSPKFALTSSPARSSSWYVLSSAMLADERAYVSPGTTASEVFAKEVCAWVGIKAF